MFKTEILKTRPHGPLYTIGQQVIRNSANSAVWLMQFRLLTVFSIHFLTVYLLRPMLRPYFQRSLVCPCAWLSVSFQMVPFIPCMSNHKLTGQKNHSYLVHIYMLKLCTIS